MKCPKCEGEKITAMNGFSMLRGATEYGMECLGCGHKWREKRGHRIRSQAVVDRWANVEMRENSFERERREELEKINIGECPRCGSDLLSDEVGNPTGKNVRYETVCESDACTMRIEGVMERERWDKEMKAGEDNE